MFKLILIAIFTYLIYSYYLRNKAASKSEKPTKNTKSEEKYSDMDISDAEFKDLNNSQ